MPTSHFDGHNIWILKCTQFNRGKGIYVFNTLEQLVSLINEIDKGLIISEATELIANSKSSSKKKQPKLQFNSADVCLPKVKSSTFVIQKYIERPLLIHKRKFDIRVWVLVTQELKVYFFKEGYLRTSSEIFSLSQDSITNQFVHLTNNAVQINSENYGKFEDGNQMSFKDISNKLTEFQDLKNISNGGSPISIKDVIESQMQNIVKVTFMSAKDSFCKDSNCNSCFEIFGFDFIVDSAFKAWLIEVNTNPCLEESSRILKEYIPRMIDDALKLTVDATFKKKSSYTSSDIQNIDISNVRDPGYSFPVTGYPNDENMWECILNLNYC